MRVTSYHDGLRRGDVSGHSLSRASERRMMSDRADRRHAGASRCWPIQALARRASGGIGMADGHGAAARGKPSVRALGGLDRRKTLRAAASADFRGPPYMAAIAWFWGARRVDMPTTIPKQLIAWQCEAMLAKRQPGQVRKQPHEDERQAARGAARDERADGAGCLRRSGTRSSRPLVRRDPARLGGRRTMTASERHGDESAGSAALRSPPRVAHGRPR